MNKAAAKTIAGMGFISKKKVVDLALKVSKEYRKRFKDEVAEGASKSDALEETLNKRKQLVNRVQSAVVFNIAKDIKETYHGEFYEWLPSDAEEPDPLHQLNYGEVFQFGVGESPGERFGCRCGALILVDENRLEL